MFLPNINNILVSSLGNNILPDSSRMVGSVKVNATVDIYAIIYLINYKLISVLLF